MVVAQGGASETLVACEAMRNGKCLELRYDGLSRIVEVHAVGRSKDGNLLMRAWQVRGGSVSNEPAGWKLFRLDDVRSVHLTDEKSNAPRLGFNRNDPAMKGGILCSL